MIRYMITNFALLTAFLFLFNQVFHRYLVMTDKRTILFKLLIGTTHGLCALLLLVFSFNINETTFIDFRHIIMMSAAYFGGYPASILTMLFLMLGRVTMFGEFTHSTFIALHSIFISGIASATIMHFVKHFWYKWLYSTLFSMSVIAFLSLYAGFELEALAYLLFVGFGGIFTATLISFFSKTQRLTKELEESEKEYRSLHALQEAIFQSAVHTSIMVFDCKGHLTLTNQATEKMLGYSIKELIDTKTPLASFYAPKRLEPNHPTEGHEWAYTRKDGSQITLLLTISPLIIDNQINGHVAVATDITERKKMEDRFKQLSLVDELTGIRNRRTFDETIRTELEKSKTNPVQSKLTLILFDVDDFKAYNDYYGHPLGDECLRRVSSIAKKVTNDFPATVARYGGEEFAIILPDINKEKALHLAETLRMSIEKEHISHKKSTVKNVVTISIGVYTCIPTASTTAMELIQKADQALYASKSGGRNCITCFSDH